MVKDIKKLEKQVKLFEQLKKVDADIIQLERMAILVNNGAHSHSVKLTVVKPKAELQDDSQDEKHDYPNIRFSFFGAFHEMAKGRVENQSHEAEVFETPLNDILTFEVLGVILSKKLAIRESIINKINSVK